MTGRRLLPAVLAAALAAPVAAQVPGDTATVVPGARYRAGAAKRALLGRSYRELWTAPVRVAVLDLDRFAGGLTPTETGGGNQTLSLRFRGADGREYAFRSVDKFPGRQGKARGPVAALVQDQVSSQVPAGGAVAARLMDATGALHVEPALYVMPDDARLGEFRERFAGMLGQLEERPGDGFAGAAELDGTDDVLERIGASPAERVHAREYLSVRLLDLVLGDWDRHADQYRWARFDGAEHAVWRPIPGDRDYAFVDYDGLLLDLARPFVVKLVRFTPGIHNLPGLREQGEAMDRRLLGELPRAAWDSAAAGLRARLTDRLIDDAVARMPDEHRALGGARIARLLRARRDDLPRAAERVYRTLAREPEVHGTDAAEVAWVDHGRDGVEVRLHRADLPEAAPHFRRRFVAAETREVRVFLRGGDDRVVVSGAGAVRVRVLGGAGDDLLEDRGTARTLFYDHEGDDRVLRGPRTHVDSRAWEPPAASGGGPLAQPPRDQGTEVARVSLHASLRPHAGLVVGAGPRRTRYGFRRHPYAVDGAVRLLASPHRRRLGVEAEHRRRWTGSEGYGWLFGRASELEAVAFRGYGNQVPALRDDPRVVAWERQLLAEGGVSVPRPSGVTLAAAAVVRRTDAERDPGAPGGTVRGLDGAWWAAGARATLSAERRDTLPLTRRGWTLTLGAEGFPVSTAGEGGAFARTRAAAAAYLPLGSGPVLAARAGTEAAWGAFPVQYAAFLGSAATVRGLGTERYAGDRSVFGGVELRQALGSGAGVFALADAGRVWHEGASAGGWHTALGGGVWAMALGQVVTLSVAHGEVPVVYAGLGLSF